MSDIMGTHLLEINTLWQQCVDKWGLGRREAPHLATCIRSSADNDIIPIFFPNRITDNTTYHPEIVLHEGIYDLLLERMSRTTKKSDVRNWKQYHSGKKIILTFLSWCQLCCPRPSLGGCNWTFAKPQQMIRDSRILRKHRRHQGSSSRFLKHHQGEHVWSRALGPLWLNGDPRCVYPCLRIIQN